MANDKRQDEIIEEFSVFDEWLDKYEYLIGLSDTLPAIAPEHRTDQYLIQGCQSRVWIDARYEDGKVWFTADSDAIITKEASPPKRPANGYRYNNRGVLLHSSLPCPAALRGVTKRYRCTSLQ